MRSTTTPGTTTPMISHTLLGWVSEGARDNFSTADRHTTQKLSEVGLTLCDFSSLLRLLCVMLYEMNSVTDCKISVLYVRLDDEALLFLDLFFPSKF